MKCHLKFPMPKTVGKIIFNPAKKHEESNKKCFETGLSLTDCRTTRCRWCHVHCGRRHFLNVGRRSRCCRHSMCVSNGILHVSLGHHGRQRYQFLAMVWLWHNPRDSPSSVGLPLLLQHRCNRYNEQTTKWHYKKINCMTTDAKARKSTKNTENLRYLGDLNNGKAKRLLFGGRLKPISCPNSSHTSRMSSSVSVSLAFKMHSFRKSFSWSDILFLFDNANTKTLFQNWADFFNEKKFNLFEFTS